MKKFKPLNRFPASILSLLLLLITGCTNPSATAPAAANDGSQSNLRSVHPAAASNAALQFNDVCPANTHCTYANGYEGGSYSMSCGAATLLTVQSAIYGAAGKLESCLTYVAAQCSGLNSCNVHFSNQNCGGDPAVGLGKTATVDVSCQSKATTPTPTPSTSPTPTPSPTATPSGSVTTVPISGSVALDFSKYSSISAMAADSTGLPYDIGYVVAGGYVTYNLNVLQSGNYSVTLNYASPGGGTGLNILINNTQEGSVAFNDTGSWAKYVNAAAVVIHLPKGAVTLKALAQNANFNLGGIAIAASNGATPTPTPKPTPTPTPGPTPTPSPTPGGNGHNPTGVSGSYTSLIDATFGSGRADATVHNRSELDSLAYYWFIFGAANVDPAYWAQGGAPNDCMGPPGDGTDGLYGNFESRFIHCAPGSPWDRHVMSTDHLTLKANCGLTDNNSGNCADWNVGGGMLRFIKSFRPTANNPIMIEMSGVMPKGRYSWPAFWLNPGEQAPRNADNSPGSVLSAAWPPEIDIFDEYGFNNTDPGHYLVSATPTGGNDARFASALCASQGLSICDLAITSGGALLPTTSVAEFSTYGWYANTTSDLTAGYHTYGAMIYPDHLDEYLDGVKYRSRGYTWPTNSPPMHLILSNQTGAKFNNLSGITDQGGVPNGWDWNVSYVRVWQKN